MHVKFRSERNDAMLAEDEIEYGGFACFHQISKTSSVIYSRVSLAKEPAMSTALKLWPPSNVGADIKDGVRSKSRWYMISPVLSYTGLRFM